jgi:hypothetical protein
MKNKKQIKREQIKEDYPVGALVRRWYWRSPSSRLYGIIIASGVGTSTDLIEVYTSDGEMQIKYHSDWEIIVRP